MGPGADGERYLGQRVKKRDRECVFVVCVCERERERDRQRKRERERASERESERMSRKWKGTTRGEALKRERQDKPTLNKTQRVRDQMTKRVSKEGERVTEGVKWKGEKGPLGEERMQEREWAGKEVGEAKAEQRGMELQ